MSSSSPSPTSHELDYLRRFITLSLHDLEAARKRGDRLGARHAEVSLNVTLDTYAAMTARIRSTNPAGGPH